jgi:hypothetical protein
MKALTSKWSILHRNDDFGFKSERYIAIWGEIQSDLRCNSRAEVHTQKQEEDAQVKPTIRILVKPIDLLAVW